jgi:hypothetical protein
VLGSHILSLKIVTKTPNHILMLFAYGFSPYLHLLRMCFFLIQTVCVTMHVYPYLLPSIGRRGVVGGCLRGDGFVRITAQCMFHIAVLNTVNTLQIKMEVKLK